ncbi:RidA family protein [Hyphobacterium sp.]|uniref:RidA family protein n=1 Tax=Hyphobacterium sp. TaxID=2004662 RepID=UPI003BAC3A4C
MIRSLLAIPAGFLLSGCLIVADRAEIEMDRAPQGMEIYRVEGLPDWAPFSSAVRAGEMLYVSGHLGRYPGTTDIVPGGAGPETTQTMANIEASLALAGATLDDLVSCTVYLTDMADYQAMNEAYAEALNGHQPARVTAGIQELALGARVEIACVAYAPEMSE